jgi:hypothetical protein
MQVLFLIATIWILTLNSATAACPTISRTNNAANSILTSTKYNADLNTVYSAVNSLDGECITTDTLPISAMESSTAGAVAKTESQGCKLIYENANTVSVLGPCTIMVDGIASSTSSASVAATGSLLGSTVYYVYASKTASLTLSMSTSGPNALGYNLTDRVIGRFKTGTSGILPNSVGNWDGYDYNKNTKICSGVIDFIANTVASQDGNSFGCFSGVTQVGLIESVPGFGEYSSTFDSNIFSVTNGDSVKPVCVFNSDQIGYSVSSTIKRVGLEWVAHWAIYISGATSLGDAQINYICTGTR